ncbi:MAG: ATP-binding protein, partial [Bradymonadaceae bacterium]
MNDTGSQTHQFEAEVNQLLDLMVNNLYQHKEVFLRELVSNASDALDQLRFAALENEDLYEGEGDLEIRIDWDEDDRTVTVWDNGIGMSREEIVDNLGTIARSGAQEFMEKMADDTETDAELIGQFGVGFYS